jgi:hypothetical protein
MVYCNLKNMFYYNTNEFVHADEDARAVVDEDE